MSVALWKAFPLKFLGEIAMKNGIQVLTMLGAIFVAFSQAPSAYAQATRTWVSGVGDDANPCSRTAPCKTWPGAISKTAAGGEIDALDPGGFGGVTITKSITLDGGGGQVASVLVSGVNGIVISAGAADVITLRNLRINGIGTGINGVHYLAGNSLIVENCEIFGFTQNGINIIPTGNTNKVAITNTTITNNGLAGVQLGASGGTTNVYVNRVQSNRNGFGFNVAPTGAAVASMTVDHSAGNLNSSDGAKASGTGTLLVSNSAFTYNSNGVNIVSPATGNTFSNNIIAQNSVNNILGSLPTNTLK